MLGLGEAKPRDSLSATPVHAPLLPAGLGTAHVLLCKELGYLEPQMGCTYRAAQ